MMDEGKSMDGSCYYSVLGVRTDASFAQIRAAYRKLALEWHPDKWANKPSLAGEANRRFQKIQEAYSVLSDQTKKSMYDAGVLEFSDDIQDQQVRGKRRRFSGQLLRPGMGDFLHDLMKMMKQNAGGKVESMEELQNTFVEMFGDDLKDFMETQDQTDRKRARVSVNKTRACR